MANMSLESVLVLTDAIEFRVNLPPPPPPVLPKTISTEVHIAIRLRVSVLTIDTERHFLQHAPACHVRCGLSIAERFDLTPAGGRAIAEVLLHGYG
jgi:hypothetical protein